MALPVGLPYCSVEPKEPGYWISTADCSIEVVCPKCCSRSKYHGPILPTGTVEHFACPLPYCGFNLPILLLDWLTPIKAKKK